MSDLNDMNKHFKLFDFIPEMKVNQINAFVMPNTGIVFGKLSKEANDILLREAMKLRENDSPETDYRSRLAGHLKHEYDFKHMEPIIAPTLMSLFQAADEQFEFLRDFDANDKPLNIKLNNLWVNFMSKNDFNPPHDHTGIMSFVIWVKIPYDLEKELAVYPAVKSKYTSCFSFQYVNILGRISTIALPISKNFEGVVCMFPAKLSHHVSPFYTTDEERISVSGNFSFEVA